MNEDRETRQLTKDVTVRIAGVDYSERVTTIIVKDNRIVMELLPSPEEIIAKVTGGAVRRTAEPTQKGRS